MKFFAITLLTALIVSALVLVGVPLYKSWATTDNCLHNAYHQELGLGQVWYPHGHQFKVDHYGYNGTGNCQCDHKWWCVEIVFCDPSNNNREVYRTQMGAYSVPATCDGDPKGDETRWCVYVHVPQAEEHNSKREWNYYFQCSEDPDCRLPTSGYYSFSEGTPEDPPDSVEWESKPCCEDPS